MKEKIKKVPAIQISKMGGLKCDNPHCDWCDMDIKTEDYKDYIDYKCPKCGEDVFTKKDYSVFKFTIWLIKVLNFILPKRVPNEDKDAIMTCNFGKNGAINSCVIEKKNKEKCEEE